jgi:hypothetical protein
MLDERSEERINLVTHPENVASQAVARRAGYRDDGETQTYAAVQGRRHVRAALRPDARRRLRWLLAERRCVGAATQAEPGGGEERHEHRDERGERADEEEDAQHGSTLAHPPVGAHGPFGPSPAHRVPRSNYGFSAKRLHQPPTRTYSQAMPNHFTPEEIAAEHGLEREVVLRFCVEHDVPVFHGRIDKTLFAAEWNAVQAQAAEAE